MHTRKKQYLIHYEMKLLKSDLNKIINYLALNLAFQPYEYFTEVSETNHNIQLLIIIS